MDELEVFPEVGGGDGKEKGACNCKPLENGAGEQIRTVVTSLEGWGSTIELRPQFVKNEALMYADWMGSSMGNFNFFYKKIFYQQNIVQLQIKLLLLKIVKLNM